MTVIRNFDNEPPPNREERRAQGKILKLVMRPVPKKRKRKRKK